MSRLTRKYLPTLKRLRRMSDRARRDYIRGAEKELLECVSECCKNLLKGNVNLTNHQKAKLRPNAQVVRALSLKKTPLKKKRRLLQKGGFLSALLPPILGALSGMLLK